MWKVSSEKQTKKRAMHSCMSMANTEDWDTRNHFCSSSLNFPDVFSLLCQTSLYSLRYSLRERKKKDSAIVLPSCSLGRILKIDKYIISHNKVQFDKQHMPKQLKSLKALKTFSILTFDMHLPQGQLVL